VPADGAWCTLCFAQLRTQEPEPVAPAPVTPEPFAMPLAAAVTAPVLSAPVPTQPVVPTQSVPTQPPAPAVAPVATAVIEEAAPTWPCSGCGDRVSLDEMVCPSCGTAFLGGVNPNVSLKIPGVGDLVGMSTGAKFGVMAGGATVLTTVIVLFLLILGHIF